jgi:hypothetical protein
MRYLRAKGPTASVRAFRERQQSCINSRLNRRCHARDERLLAPTKRAGLLKKRERKTQRTGESSTENSVVVDTETFGAPWSHVPTTPFSPRIRPQPGTAATGTVEVEKCN